MSQNKLLKYMAVPGKTIMVFTILLCVKACLQFATPKIINELFLGEKDLQYSTHEEENAVTRQERIDISEKEFLPDGTIHLVYHVPPAKDGQRRDADFSEHRQRTVKVYDANDTLLWSGDYPDYTFPLFRPSLMRLGAAEIYDANDNLLWKGDRGDCSYTYLPHSSCSGSMDLVSGWHLECNQIFEFSRVLTIPVISHDQKIVQRWRYDPIHRYFIGLDLNGRRIGFAGANGIKKSQREIEPFEEFRCMTAWCSKYSDSPVVLWQTIHTLYQISFEKGIFELLYEISDARLKPIFLLNNWMGFERNYKTKFLGEKRREYYKNMYESRPAVQLYTEDGGQYLLLRDPVERIKLELPDEMAMGWTRIIIHKDRIFLRYEGPKEKPDPIKFKPCKYCGKYHNYNPAERKVELYSVDNRGSLKLINRFAWTRPEKHEEKIAAIESPGVYWHHGMGHSNLPNFVVFDFLSGFHPTNKQTNCSLTVLLVIITFWHVWPRRTTKAKLIFWLVLVALFNLAGFLTYLALNHTTVICCPSCGKKRGLQRPDCPACKALLQEPKHRETDLILVGQSNS